MEVGHSQIKENPIKSFFLYRAGGFSLSLTGRTSALRDANTSVINSRLAGSSATTRSFSGA